jgi:N-acetylneuraminic acid mutarotase
MKKHLVLFLWLAVVFSACQHVEEVPITDWVQLQDFPGAPRCSGAAFAVGGKGYICCGRTDWEIGYLNETWCYDVQDSTWTRVSDFPGIPRYKPVGVVINGKAYVGMGAIGTHDTIQVQKDFWEYDPQTDTWTQKASFPGVGSNDLTYGVVNGFLYTAMGYDGKSRSDETWKYDPIADAWTKLPDCPTSYSVPAFFVLGDYFYVGTGFQGRNIRTFYRYNTLKDKWFDSASAPNLRMLSNGLAVNGKGYVMLGRFWNGTENNGRLLSDIIEYDPAENAWTKKGDFPGGARQNAMVFTVGDRGYIVMGEGETQRKSDVWSFKP